MMEAKDISTVLQAITIKFPGTDPDFDIDWDMTEIIWDEAKKQGIKDGQDLILKSDSMADILHQAKQEERKAIQDLYQTKEGDIVIPQDDWQNRGKA